ncbi:MAG: hypothetical protein Q7R71_01680, partial [bacterium]|nr:hypothetical protein [bacterium]
MNFFADRPIVQPMVVYPEVVKVSGAVNTHTHPRDTDKEKDGRAEIHIPLLAEVYEFAFCMGNTKPPLTTSILAMAKRLQWELLIPPKRPLQLKIGGLMTEATSPEDVVAGYDQPEGKVAWDYMKMFVRSASNAHGADVDDMAKIIPVLKAMTYTKFTHRKHPMTLAIHMERKYDLFGRRINFLQRERVSVERDLSYLFQKVPDAKIVVCHVTDAYTLEVIRHLRLKGFNVWGELCPHYSVWSCDDLVEAPDGGTMFNSHLFCLPIFKTEADRQANEVAMLSGEKCWIHGCDDACWPDDPTKDGGVKINNKGFVIGGETQLPRANVSYVIERFVEADRLDLLPSFLSLNARDAYGLESPQS